MPSDLRQCAKCTGRFAKQYYNDYFSNQECRLCENRRQLEEGLNEVRCKYSKLQNEFESLQEFVVLNITSSTQEKPQDEPQPTANQAIRPVLLSPSPTPRTRSQQTPTVPTPRPRYNRSSPRPVGRVSPPQVSGFTPVRNGARPMQKRSHLHVTTSNRFEILVEMEDEPEETRLVGDSILRGQIVEFCDRVPNRRKRFCIPGAGLDDIVEAYDDTTKDASEKTLFVIHAGSNDVMRTRSEELMEKYRKMIQHYKNKSRNIIISGILPKIDAPDLFYDKAFSTNSRLKSLCLKEEVEFINLWDHFYNQHILFSKDGTHLNSVGSARMGRLLHEAVRSHGSKNATREEAAGAT